ncbi:MbtH family protein [Dactylosporangium sp. NBC_01737]|uniref:MbtH family protein n=1 Tax=Dactylosporangium sp. NBC_01737 TaxID=2975959 RepID=UPI002E0DB240|nr:MbtH family protein [Dactylosporangium sp. NBC_01737]
MSGPFEDPSVSYTVLVNGEGQYSLWPLFAAVPPGWLAAAAAGTRSECLAYVEEHCTGGRQVAATPAGLDGVTA